MSAAQETPAAAVPAASVGRASIAWRGGVFAPGRRELAEEVPVAFSYDNSVHAVMMATPADLADFALGFSLTEGIVSTAADIAELEVVPVEAGVNLRMWLAPGMGERQAARRRRSMGPAGCGMCGLESLAEASRAVPVVTGGRRFGAGEVAAALAALPAGQALNRATHAVHAAGFWADGAMRLLREDVGRHNALDKLAGALAAAALDPADGIVVLSSRLSVELVQKAAMIGAPLLAAVSAPTALAVRIAEAAGITLVGIGRGDGFELFCHRQRVMGEQGDDGR